MSGKRMLSILLAAVLLLPSLADAQTTRVKGRVTDADTGEGLPFANVYFKGTTIGVSTDLDGYYTLETRDLTVDLLRFEMLSYIPQEKQIK